MSISEVIPIVETDTEVNLQGYKIEVNGTDVTPMRVFRNETAQEAIINIQDSLLFDETVNPQAIITALRTTGVYDGGDPVIAEAKVRFYDVVINKITGDVTESSLGSHVFTNIFNGLFGNFRQSVNQVTGAVLSSKFLRGGKYNLGKNAIDVVSLYGSWAVEFYDLGGALITTVSTTAYKVVNVDLFSHGFTNMEYKVVCKNAGSYVFEFWINKSNKADGSNSKINNGNTTATPDYYCADQVDSTGNPTSGTSGTGGTNSAFYGDSYYNILFEHPWGGIDSIGSCNLTGFGGSSERVVLNLDRKVWKRTAIGTPHLSNQSPNELSTSDNVSSAKGFASMSYEFYSETIDELWLAAVSASKRAFVAGNRNVAFGCIQGVIESISASYDEYQDGYRAWKVSVNFRQTVAFYG